MVKKNNASHATEKYPYQVNTKLTEEDMQRVLVVNTRHFEGDASMSMLIRILVRKGLDFYIAKASK